MLKIMGGVVFAGALAVGGAMAQSVPGHKVTVTLTGTHSSAGEVLVGLCGDRSGAFPGGCNTYRAKAKATLGATVVTFAGVAPGTYALQAWHDENSDGRMNFPQEGYAMGNDAASFPPTFDAAAIRVEGATAARATMMYRGAAMGAPTAGASGAAAPAGAAKIDVREAGLYAELYVPPHAKPVPAIILIGGSGPANARAWADKWPKTVAFFDRALKGDRK